MHILYYDRENQRPYERPEVELKIADNIRQLPQRTGLLDKRHEARFHELFAKLYPEAKAEDGSPAKLSKSEREELALCIKEMEVSHVISWRRRHFGCDPVGTLTYELHDVHHNVAMAALDSVRAHAQRLEKNGVTHFVIGRVAAGSEDEGKIKLHFIVDRDVHVEELYGYPRPGGFGFGQSLPKQRYPHQLGPFYVSEHYSVFEGMPTPRPISELTGWTGSILE